MNVIFTQAILLICSILTITGVLYCLWDGRIDIEFLNLRIKGKGGKRKE
jgi:hypothetical protein